MAGYARAFAVPLDPAPWRMVLGVALAQAAGVLVLAALYVLWRAKTGINPLDPSRARALVTRGVYRWSRNPMYLSLLLLLVAYAVRLDAWAVWLGPVLFVAYVNRFQIQPEERALEAKFGEAYGHYRARTRRWL